jgi:hypothetical protein
MAQAGAGGSRETEGRKRGRYRGTRQEEESNMRIPMAVVLLLAGGMLVLGAPADAADGARKHKSKRIAKQQPYKAKRYTREQRLECERAEQEDPTGQYKGFPCWAREVFGRASRPFIAH